MFFWGFLWSWMSDSFRILDLVLFGLENWSWRSLEYLIYLRFDAGVTLGSLVCLSGEKGALCKNHFWSSMWPLSFEGSKCHSTDLMWVKPALQSGGSALTEEVPHKDWLGKLSALEATPRSHKDSQAQRLQWACFVPWSLFPLILGLVRARLLAFVWSLPSSKSFFPEVGFFVCQRSN